MLGPRCDSLCIEQQRHSALIISACHHLTTSPPHHLTTFPSSQPPPPPPSQHFSTGPDLTFPLLVSVSAFWPSPLSPPCPRPHLSPISARHGSTLPCGQETPVALGGVVAHSSPRPAFPWLPHKLHTHTRPCQPPCTVDPSPDPGSVRCLRTRHCAQPGLHPAVGSHSRSRSRASPVKLTKLFDVGWRPELAVAVPYCHGGAA